MDSAAELLVIILSTVLAFFLTLAIVLTIYLIGLTKQIRRVTDSVEKTVSNLESASAGMSRMVSPIFVAKMVGKVVKSFKKRKD